MAGSGRQHLGEVDIAYGPHLWRAWRIGGALLVASGACFVHGLLPGRFTDKATRTIIRLNDELKAHAPKGSAPTVIEFEI